jgi:hypothetical protein
LFYNILKLWELVVTLIAELLKPNASCLLARHLLVSNKKGK